MKVFVISDIHGEAAYIDRAADLINSSDLIILSGDISGRTGKRGSAEKIISSLEQFNKRMLAVHGNWDRRDVLDLLVEKNYSIHGEGKIVNGTGFFGVGGSNITPMDTPTEYDDEKIYEFLAKGYEMVSGADRRICVSHAPPKGIKDRTFLGLHAGSSGVKRFLEGHDVDLCLCGHIHEAYGIKNIDGMVVVNSGTFRKGRYVLVKINTSITAVKGKL